MSRGIIIFILSNNKFIPSRKRNDVLYLRIPLCTCHQLLESLIQKKDICVLCGEMFLFANNVEKLMQRSN